jgi:Universal stress protein family
MLDVLHSRQSGETDAGSDETSDTSDLRRQISENVATYGEQHRGVTVEDHVLDGLPVDELTQRSDRADLVVVGSRGRSRDIGALLGSVSHPLLEHARCPVAVVSSDQSAVAMQNGRGWSGESRVRAPRTPDDATSPRRLAYSGQQRRAGAGPLDRNYRRVGQSGLGLLTGQTGGDHSGDGQHLRLLPELPSIDDTS